MLTLYAAAITSDPAWMQTEPPDMEPLASGDWLDADDAADMDLALDREWELQADQMHWEAMIECQRLAACALNELPF